MKSLVKKMLKIIIPKSLKEKISFVKVKNYIELDKYGTIKKIICIFRWLLSHRFLNKKIPEAKRIVKLYKKITPSGLNNEHFIYFINEKYIFDYSLSNYSNGTIDYSLVVNNSLLDLKEKTSNPLLKEEVEAIIEIINIIKKRNSNNEYSNILLKMVDHKDSSLKEALQRVLFINQLLWQTNHTLIGLGRMDKYLSPFLGEASSSAQLFEDFFYSLHKDYKFKSGVLYGDTGQVIILGGTNKDGTYFSNAFTSEIIKTCIKANTTDPKIFMRVGLNTPPELLELCCKCMRTGNGSPLLSNDEVVIKCLKNFGYEEEDCYNYICSACWEPYPEGLAVESNNEAPLNFVIPFINMMDSLNDDDTEETIVKKYKASLLNYLKPLADYLIHKEFSDDLISSIFIEPCLLSNKTIREHGPKYNNIGCTGVGLGNVINSICAFSYITSNNLCGINEYVKIVKNNFLEKESLRNEIKENANLYGTDDKRIVEVTNEIINFVSDYFASCDTKDRKIKFGLSSPQYIVGGRISGSTPDGRKSGEPMLVHISSSRGLAYSELINFASEINYCTRCFNGNVVDLMISPAFIDSDFDKFVLFIKMSIKKGFFQMQANVVDSKTLIEAKKHPENYQQLIVRVWGFSAYFVELPEEYQNLLIERALLNESVN